MAELSYLGKLLGLPHMLDPTFNLAYSTLFGAKPTIGEGSVKVENPVFVQESNVS